jgi:hypothetical protein
MAFDGRNAGRVDVCSVSKRQDSLVSLPGVMPNVRGKSSRAPGMSALPGF